MVSLDVNENFCRICLEPKVALSWNEELFDFCGVTYKDCYYHYTQLDESDVDPFSSMLCKLCSDELKNAHFFIKKALESFRILQQTYMANCHIDEDLKDSSIIETNQELEEFEICSVNESPKTIIEHEHDVKLLDLETEAEPENAIQTSLDRHECLTIIEDNAVNSKLRNETNETSLIHRWSKRKISDQNDELDTKAQSSSSAVHKKCSAKNKKVYMCAYCSLIALDKYQLRIHEETHDKNRKRKEVCPSCGLKFYNKIALKGHIDTHKENRVKNYKCEFCDKAYFNRGGLNIHRRIHLGQMRKCTICPKEFCREVDLNRHMENHSIIPLNQVKKSKYVVHCKDCNSQIPIRRWKAHKASHKNQPEVKCKICNRDFFSRANCTKHMKRMHNKTRDEYETNIHYYIDKSKARLSHFKLQQLETVEAV